MRRLALVALLLIAACGDDDTATAPTAPPGTTTAEGADPVLEGQIAAIYPDVPVGKATDWAIALCGDIAAGMDGDALLERAAARFAGGLRPDPTPEQAAQILEVVRPTCP